MPETEDPATVGVINYAMTVWLSPQFSEQQRGREGWGGKYDLSARGGLRETHNVATWGGCVKC